MNREQVGNRAIANIAVALDLDPGALKLIREEIELAFDEGSRAEFRKEYHRKETVELGGARCDNCGKPMDQPRGVYENDATTLVCSERCALELKAHDAERWAYTGQHRIGRIIS
jgi:hypothetical protein